jgi:outer membrane protein OmpA-like peptidoglycan-associated protein
MKSIFKRMPATAAVATFVTVILAACATPPQHNDMLEHARGVVAIAQANPNVAGESRADLTTAVAALNQGDTLIKEGKPTADVEHQAYIAERFGLAAERGAEFSMSEKAIADAQNRRNAVLLSAREQQVVRANDRAATKTLEADAANASAQASAQQNAAAQQRALELENALADLQAKKTDRGLVITLGDVLFATGRADLKPGARHSLEKLSGFLHEYPQRTVQIEGYTDSVGTDDYNQGLSERRASSVRDALTSMGVSGDRIQTRGLGKSSPVADNGSESGRQMNRRVEVIISESDGRTATLSP